MHIILSSEADALQALIQGREEGLDFFFNTHYSSLVLFAGGIVKDPVVAEDLAQEAFVKLWAYREHLNEEGSVKGWLFRTVRNLCVDHLRQRKRSKEKEQGVVSLYSIEPSPFHLLVQAETVRQIASALELLPPRCRKIFQLFYLEDKSLKQIAEELQVSVNTVKTQKQRALQLLRGSLGILLFTCSLLGHLLEC